MLVDVFSQFMQSMIVSKLNFVYRRLVEPLQEIRKKKKKNYDRDPISTIYIVCIDER